MMAVYLVGQTLIHRRGLQLIFAGNAAFDVIGSGGEIDAVLADLQSMRTDAVVVDLGGQKTTTLFFAVASMVGARRVAVIACPDDSELVIGLVEAGVGACLSQDASAEELTDAILAIGYGRFRCSAAISQILARRLAAKAKSVERPAIRKLTAREHQVATHIVDQASNKVIARRMGVSHNTVKNHVHSILQKIGAPNRTEAARMLRKTQWSDPSNSPTA